MKYYFPLGTLITQLDDYSLGYSVDETLSGSDSDSGVNGTAKDRWAAYLTASEFESEPDSLSFIPSSGRKGWCIEHSLLTGRSPGIGKRSLRYLETL